MDVHERGVPRAVRRVKRGQKPTVKHEPLLDVALRNGVLVASVGRNRDVTVTMGPGFPSGTF